MVGWDITAALRAGVLSAFRRMRVLWFRATLTCDGLVRRQTCDIDDLTD
jgi:hypothetical protein